MKKYPKYKASGIDWFGEIPEHWVVGKIKRALKIITDFTANGSFADLAKNVKYINTPDYSRLIRLTDLRSGLQKDGMYVSKEAHEYLSKSELFGGEILLANVGSAGVVCRVPKIEFKATLAPNMLLLKFEKKIISNQYAFILLDSDFYQKLLINKALSSVMPKLNKEDVKSIDFIFPPSQEEQHAIVRFLDYKTGQIDSFIANRQKQIELLKEQKAGIINKAVTKGINPNVKMKDSGIEWIGYVPEHWDFKSLRRITKEHRQGYYIDAPYITEGVKLVRITDLHSDGSIDYSEMPFVKISKEHEKLYSIEDGDFLFPRTGTIGSLGFVSNPERAVFASYLIRFRFKSNKILNDYLYYYFMSDAFLDGVFSDLHGGVVQNIHAENIKNQFIAHPKDLAEQESIIMYIKSETSTIDTLISKYQKQINLMHEYRTSLISQAVTGKIDVREWQPKKQQAV
jgi:type I restriction enzyme S subunit